MLKIAVASGKGGTGKTTIAVALAQAAAEPVTMLDCDVEAPNAHLFLRPAHLRSHEVSVPVPCIDTEKCTHCGKCAEFCQYNALAALPDKVLIFPELCHGCGGCLKICPVGAMTETTRAIGCIETGDSDAVTLLTGRLNVGEAMAPPLIRALKKEAPHNELTVLDCPPGASCPVVTAVRDADYVLLVTEPTPFGLHDLRLAVETMRALGLPHGVIINRADIGDGRVEHYCAQENVPVLMRINHDRRVAEACSRGASPLEVMPELKIELCEILRLLRANRPTLHTANVN